MDIYVELKLKRAKKRETENLQLIEDELLDTIQEAMVKGKLPGRELEILTIHTDE